MYGDLSGANAYFSAAIQGAPWSAASSSTRNQALVTATRVFDRTLWQGAPTDPITPAPPAIPPLTPGVAQALEWPRTGLSDQNDVAVPSDSIPLDIVNGSFEYALALINDAALQQDPSTGSNVKVDKLTERIEGAVTVSTEKQFFQPTISTAAQFPNIVQELVGQYLASTKAATGIFAGGTGVAVQSGQDFCLNDGGFAS